MTTIELDKNYNLGELIHQERFNTSRIKFLTLKNENAISDIFSIRISSDNKDDFNEASNFILEKLHRVKNILNIKKKTLLNILYEDGKTNIIYGERLPTDKIPKDYSYENTIEYFIKTLQSKKPRKYSYRKFITDQRKKNNH